MIRKLHIQNFKSIKDLELDCARVNVFIGEPNTGKSNILESLGTFTLSLLRGKGNILPRKLIRMEKNYHIFFNENTEEKINIDIELDNYSKIFTLWTYTSEGIVNSEFSDSSEDILRKHKFLSFDSNLSLQVHFNLDQALPIRFFKFEQKKDYSGREGNFLTPPDGDNLPQMIRLKSEIKEFVHDLFAEYGYKVNIDKHENNISIYRESHISESLPYFLSSDTIQRIIFFYTAIETNKNAVLIFEEPESHVFPFYNKFLAERIALYNTNQFFIATHNPTFLANFIEQTPDEELKIFITYYEDYQTKVFELSGGKLHEAYKIFGVDIFANLDKIVKHLDKIIEKEKEDSL